MAKTPTDIASLARSHTRTAIRTLARIMKQPEAPYAARVAAAEALLDRGWGKPKQSHEAEITHRYVIEIPALMDNATWEAEAIEHEPDKLQRASADFSRPGTRARSPDAAESRLRQVYAELGGMIGGNHKSERCMLPTRSAGMVDASHERWTCWN